MAYSRRLVHYGPGPSDFQSVISDRAIEGCWFELHRLGGCGAGEVLLKDNFTNRNTVNVGDWIAYEYAEGDLWYFGRVENRQAKSPSGIQLRLEGMSIQMGEVFPGGFGVTDADGVPPHRYAATDLFSYDPDRMLETMDSVNETDELVKLLMQQYVVPQTDISLNLSRIEGSSPPAQVVSHKFRGEESVRSIMKDLSMRTKDASWGVDETGEFFFLQKKSNLVATFQEGVDLVKLEEMVDRETMFNRLTLTGGYVYSANGDSSNAPPRFSRWRGNYLEPSSRALYGDRRIRINVPWLRTREDSRDFAREFFRVYSQPYARYEVQVAAISSLPKPWEGAIRILNRAGEELVTRQVETVRIQFDQTPLLFVDLGPGDPRTQWPEPEYDQRWEIPAIAAGAGGSVSVTFSVSSEGSSSESESSSDSSSDISSVFSSDYSEDSSSVYSSDSSSDMSSSSGSSSSSMTSSSSGEESSSEGETSSTSGGETESSSGTGGLLLKDLFTDTSTNIYTHLMDVGESGPNTVGWGNFDGSWSIYTPAGILVGGVASGDAHILADAGQASMEVLADIRLGIPATGGSADAGLHCCCTWDGKQGWLLWLDGKWDEVYLYQWGDGVGVVRDSASVSLNYGSVYSARIQVNGTSIESEVAGVTLSYTASIAPTDTFAGFRIYEARPGGSPPSGAIWFDNFYVNDV